MANERVSDAPLMLRLVYAAEALAGYSTLAFPEANGAWTKWLAIKDEALKSATAELTLSTLRSPHQGEVEAVATMHKSETETLFSKGWVPALMGFTSTPLYLQPSVPKAGERDAEALERENKALREALKPFAHSAGFYARDGLNEDEFVVNVSTMNRAGEEVEAVLKRGDFARAKAALVQP